MALLASGCAPAYTLTALSGSGVTLDREQLVAIAMPANGTYDGREFESSGQSTASAVRGAFARFARDTIVVAGCQTVACLIEQSGTTADYLVVPEILRWEDRPPGAEWSGRKDEVALKLSVYDGATGAELASSMLAARNIWAPLGGDHPQDLLSEPIRDYVATLFPSSD